MTEENLINNPVLSLFRDIKVRDIMEERKFSLDMYNKIFDLLENIKERCKNNPEDCEYHLNGLSYYLKNNFRFKSGYYTYSGHVKFSKENIDAIKKDRDYNIWSILMKKSGIYYYISEAYKYEWDQRMKNGDFSEINYENIINYFKKIYENREEIIYDFIITFFKRNSRNKEDGKIVSLCKKIILTSSEHLDNIMRIFLIANNRWELDFEMVYVMERNYEARGKWEGEYFYVNWYENGNYHIIFKDIPELELINSIALSDREQGINLIKQKIFNKIT